MERPRPLSERQTLFDIWFIKSGEETRRNNVHPEDIQTILNAIKAGVDIYNYGGPNVLFTPLPNRVAETPVILGNNQEERTIPYHTYKINTRVICKGSHGELLWVMPKNPVRSGVLKTLEWNGEKTDISHFDLPMLIHGTEGSGASFFTMQLVLHYLERRNDVIFYSAFKPAREYLEKCVEKEFYEVITDASQIQQNSQNRETRQLIIPESGNVELFMELINTLDVSQKLVVVKNVESLDEEILQKLLQLQHVIFSGDTLSIDSLQKAYLASYVLFSDLKKFGLAPMHLEKYEGYMEGAGLVALTD